MDALLCSAGFSGQRPPFCLFFPEGILETLPVETISRNCLRFLKGAPSPWSFLFFPRAIYAGRSVRAALLPLKGLGSLLSIWDELEGLLWLPVGTVSAAI